MQTVTLNRTEVKPIFITDATALRMGVEDGRAGETEWVGYNFFVGAKYAEWRKGWQLGRKGAAKQGLRTAQVMPGDFAGALEDVAKHGLRFTRKLTNAEVADIEDSEWN